MQLFRLILPLLDKHYYNYSPLMISIINYIGLIIQHWTNMTSYLLQIYCYLPQESDTHNIPGHSYISQGHHRTSQDTPSHIPRTPQDIPGHSYTSPRHTPHPQDTQDIPGHPRTLLHIPGTPQDIPGHSSTSPGHPRTIHRDT